MTGMLISAFALLATAEAGLVCEMQRIHHFQRAVILMRAGRVSATAAHIRTVTRYRRARNLCTAAAVAAGIAFIIAGTLA